MQGCIGKFDPFKRNLRRPGRLTSFLAGLIIASCALFDWTSPVLAWQVSTSGLRLGGKYTLPIGLLLCMLAALLPYPSHVSFRVLLSFSVLWFAVKDVNLMISPEAHPPISTWAVSVTFLTGIVSIFSSSAEYFFRDENPRGLRAGVREN
jgi:RsiW-degrading membrane proteinase PrsW (M82 family)